MSEYRKLYPNFAGLYCAITGHEPTAEDIERMDKYAEECAARDAADDPDKLRAALAEALDEWQAWERTNLGPLSFQRHDRIAELRKLVKA